jgi:hypothetical protein
MADAASAAHHRGAMSKPIDVLLIEYDAAGGPVQLRAVLDELTLTYTVVDRSRGRRTRELRRHLSSLREARQWANRHAAQRICAAEPKADRAA